MAMLFLPETIILMNLKCSYYLFDAITVPSSPPRNVTATAISSSEIRVVWQPPERPNGIVAYRLISYLNNGHSKEVYNGYKTKFTVQYLTPNRMYTFGVIGYNVGQNLTGPSSLNATVMTLKGKGKYWLQHNSHKLIIGVKLMHK